jgi:elongation factor Ts
MATITAQMVKELRERTGAGMMDCKNALGETAGDLEGAVDWLRKKGLAKAAKKSGRVAAEGLVGLAVNAASGVLVEVNSETDFVARNEQFQALVRGIAAAALGAGSEDVAAINGTALPDGRRVDETITGAIATIGENMTFRRAARLSVGSGAIGAYMHNAIGDGLGRIGVLVALESAAPTDKLAGFARALAMHVAASSPVALEPAGVPADIVEREKAILAEKNAGKPAHVLTKIVESGLEGFYKEACLMKQSYVHDQSKTVAQAVKDQEKAAGAPITLKAFVRFAIGEGIEKEAGEDFASEVAAAIKPKS